MQHVAKKKVTKCFTKCKALNQPGNQPGKGNRQKTQNKKRTKPKNIKIKRQDTLKWTFIYIKKEI